MQIETNGARRAPKKAAPPAAGARKFRTAAQRAATAERSKSRLAIAAATPLPDTGFVGVEDLLVRLKVSRSTLNAWIKRGIVPAPHKPTSKVRLWTVSQARKLLEASSEVAA